LEKNCKNKIKTRAINNFAQHFLTQRWNIFFSKYFFAIGQSAASDSAVSCYISFIIKLSKYEIAGSQNHNIQGPILYNKHLFFWRLSLSSYWS